MISANTNQLLERTRVLHQFLLRSVGHGFQGIHLNSKATVGSHQCCADETSKKTEDTTLHLLVYIYERRALNSKCWHWLHWINKFRWQNGWNIVKFHPMIFKLQDFRSSTERSSETHSRLQPASSTNSKRTKSRTCNVTDSTASRMELSDFAKKNAEILCSFQERNK